MAGLRLNNYGYRVARLPSTGWGASKASTVGSVRLGGFVRRDTDTDKRKIINARLQ